MSGNFPHFPLVSAISKQISAIVLDRLWGLKPILASSKSHMGHVRSPIRFTHVNAPSTHVSLHNEYWFSVRALGCKFDAYMTQFQ